MVQNQSPSRRGFAGMDQARQREIASKGGQSVPPEKRSFSQNPELAAEAGRKGGEHRGHSAHQGARGNAGNRPDEAPVRREPDER